jgi:hypothetical protein
MANVYVEARRPKGRDPIVDYVVEDHANSVLATCKTHEEANARAKRRGHKPLVARIHRLNDKRIPDRWRSAD